MMRMLLAQVKPSYMREFHKVTQAQMEEKIPVYDCSLGNLSSMIPVAFTPRSVYQNLFVMFIPSSVPLNLVLSLWGKTEEFSDIINGIFRYHQCPRLGCHMQVLGN